jgi:hypothetical protein
MPVWSAAGEGEPGQFDAVLVDQTAVGFASPFGDVPLAAGGQQQDRVHLRMRTLPVYLDGVVVTPVETRQGAPFALVVAHVVAVEAVVRVAVVA